VRFRAGYGFRYAYRKAIELPRIVNEHACPSLDQTLQLNLFGLGSDQVDNATSPLTRWPRWGRIGRIVRFKLVSQTRKVLGLLTVYQYGVELRAVKYSVRVGFISAPAY
jgi:hypothetical protein